MPRQAIAAAIVALHCLPLSWMLLDAPLAPPLLWPLCALAVAHLALRLHRQRAAAGATRLVATANGWRLRTRDATSDDDGDDAMRAQRIDRIDALDLRFCIVLRATRRGRSFHLALRAGEQSREQLHRLRVLLRAPPQSEMED
ncbi:MAG: hypothetical protein ACR2P7_06070 [bacterium]